MDSRQMSGGVAEKPRKMRQSCDNCQNCKVRCGQQQPACSRCIARGVKCCYSPSRRMGRPRDRRHGHRQAEPAEETETGGAAHIQSSQDHASVSGDGSSPLTTSGGPDQAVCEQTNGYSQYVDLSDAGLGMDEQAIDPLPPLSIDPFYQQTMPLILMSSNVTPQFSIDDAATGQQMTSEGISAFHDQSSALGPSDEFLKDFSRPDRRRPNTALPMLHTTSVASPSSLAQDPFFNPVPSALIGPRRACDCTAKLLQVLIRLTKRTSHNRGVPVFITDVLRQSKEALDKCATALECRSCIAMPTTILSLCHIVAKITELLRRALSITNVGAEQNDKSDPPPPQRVGSSDSTEDDSPSTQSSNRSMVSFERQFNLRLEDYVVPQSESLLLIRRLVSSRFRQTREFVTAMERRTDNKLSHSACARLCMVALTDCNRRTALDSDFPSS